MLYKVTNAIDGKFYIGKHKTEDVDDGYMGSGLLIRRAIKKHGPGSFTKEIIRMFDSEKELDRAERRMVTKAFCRRRDTYNIVEGGHGGFGYVNELPLLCIIRGSKRQDAMETEMTVRLGEDWRKVTGRNAGLASLQRRVGIFDPKYMENPINFGTRPDVQRKAARSAMSAAASAKRKDTFKRICHQAGPANSCYGLIWITNGTDSRKIDPVALSVWQWRGYRAGRKMPVRDSRSEIASLNWDSSASAAA